MVFGCFSMPGGSLLECHDDNDENDDDSTNPPPSSSIVSVCPD